MNLLDPSSFFDLSYFRHRILFEGCHYIWEVVSKIKPYLQNVMPQREGAKISPQAFLEKPETIFIGEGSVVEAGAYIRGPCIIGKGCTIRHGCYIRGDFIAGDGCVIGHCTEVKNVIFLNRVHAAHFAYIGDSILGSDVNLGAGAKCANVKFDSSQVVVRDGAFSYETYLRKLGAIVGDGAQVGCNGVTYPGTFLGKNSLIYPCVACGGVIPSDCRVTSGSKHAVSTLKEKVEG